MKKIILVDSSGSMAEEGKKSVVKYILYAIEGIIKADWANREYDILFWNEKIGENNGKMNFEGSCNMKAIREYCNQNADVDLLFVTDGNYSSELSGFLMEKKIKSIALAVGNDSNKARLMKTFGMSNVYQATDVTTCINNFMQL